MIAQPMTSTTTLLVTQDSAVIQEIQHLHDRTELAQLEVCGRFEKVPARLGPGNTFLILHSAPSVDPERIRGLLGAADRALVPAMVVWRPDGRSDVPPAFEPFPVYR